MKIRPPVITVFALAFISGIAFTLRTYFPHHTVFAGDWVRFQGTDAWYHMRLVENLVHHFPHRIGFDPYALYPGGEYLAVGPLYDLLIGFFVLVINPRSPSKQLIDTVGAYFPAILGALVTIPVYFLGRALFDRKAALVAAALIAILPGGLLPDSLLGATDHHIAETLFSTTTMLFLILGVNSSTEEGISFHSLWSGQWRTLRTPLIYSLLAGLALGCYLLTWMRGALLVLLILMWTTIQYILDHVRGRSPDYLCIVVAPCLFIALIMVLPFLGHVRYMEHHVESLLGSLIALPLLSSLSFLVTRTKMKQAYYLLVVVLFIGIAFGVLYLVAPSVLGWFLTEASRLRPGEKLLTVVEARPLLFLAGSFSFAPAWVRFTTGFFLAPISLAIIAVLVIKQGAADKALLFVWSVVMFIATLGQNRFTYYLVVNIALLTGYLCSKILEWGGFKRDPEKLSANKENRGESGEAQSWGAKVTRALVVIAVFFWVFYPNIGLAIKAAHYDFGPHQDWYEALVWMRRNTPEPFQNPDYYYAFYKKPAAGESYHYPESAYGVMSWWDYGYWIINIARRIPNANPSQGGATEAGLFFTSQDETSANEWLDKLGSRYVIVDDQLPMWHIPGGQFAFGKFETIAVWAGKSSSQFFEEYQQRGLDGKLVPVFLYYPEYYKTMLSRLYLFEGKAVVPQDSTWIISYIEKNETGQRYKEISTAQRFATYEDAEAYLKTQSVSNYRLVGMNPFASCVPLEELRRYKLIYKSPTTRFSPNKPPSSIFPPMREISNVEIFEYQKPF